MRQYIEDWLKSVIRNLYIRFCMDDLEPEYWVHFEMDEDFFEDRPRIH